MAHNAEVCGPPGADECDDPRDGGVDEGRTGGVVDEKGREELVSDLPCPGGDAPHEHLRRTVGRVDVRALPLHLGGHQGRRRHLLLEAWRLHATRVVHGEEHAPPLELVVRPRQVPAVAELVTTRKGGVYGV